MDLTAAKQQFANDMVALARETLQLVQKLDYLNAAFSVHGFQAGGKNAFTDGDFGTQNTQLSASIVNDVMFALGTLDADATTGIRNSLLECIPGGQP